MLSITREGSKEGSHQLGVSGSDERLPTSPLDDLNDIVTIQSLPQITERNGWWFCGSFLRAVTRVDGKNLIMAECINRVLGKETGMMYGAMIDHLQQGIILVTDRGVVDVHKPVRAS